MADLTPETLAEWRQDSMERNSRPPTTWFDDRILTLLDALDVEKARADTAEAAAHTFELLAAARRIRAYNAEAALSRVLDALAAEKARAEQAERWLENARENIEQYRQRAERYRQRAEGAKSALGNEHDMHLAAKARAEQAEIDLRQMEGSRAYWKRTAERSEAEREVWQKTAERKAAQAHNAEAALSRVLSDVETLGMRADGIVDADGGRWVPCADVLDLIEKYRAGDGR